MVPANSNLYEVNGKTKDKWATSLINIILDLLVQENVNMNFK